ncbi:MAG: hypothetical protein V2A56_13870 [bacterium]
MMVSKGGAAPVKSEAKLTSIANGIVASLRGRLSLEQIHGWIDKVSATGHCNWAIIDMREMRASEGGVWSTLEMGFKKIAKKGARRIVFVVGGQDQIGMIQSATKRAGISAFAEYFDASTRAFDQTKIINYLREHSNDKK